MTAPGDGDARAFPFLQGKDAGKGSRVPGAQTGRQRASLDQRTMPFGKYRGECLEDIAYQDPDYLEWVLENMDNLSNDLTRDITEVLRRCY